MSHYITCPMCGAEDSMDADTLRCDECGHGTRCEASPEAEALAEAVEEDLTSAKKGRCFPTYSSKTARSLAAYRAAFPKEQP